MKVYVKKEEHPGLLALSGWNLRGTLVKEDIPVTGEIVKSFIDKDRARMYRANGRYVVFKGEDRSKFYELID